METATIARLALSTIIYAPGAIMLALFAFFGTVAFLEKSGIIGKVVQSSPAGANPAPAHAVSALDASLKATEQGSRKVSNS